MNDSHTTIPSGVKWDANPARQYRWKCGNAAHDMTIYIEWMRHESAYLVTIFDNGSVADSFAFRGGEDGPEKWLASAHKHAYQRASVIAGDTLFLAV